MSKKRVYSLLFAAALLLWSIVGVASTMGTRAKTTCYEAQLDAYRRMETAMQAVKDYKQAYGIEFSPLDLRKTGMIGEEYNGITTTLGALEAKRTTADPNMAAMVVRMFTEAGLAAGDNVGAGFSGSFPALNLAVIAACDAMELNLTYISSVGASTYGANNPQLTFPEMAHLLYMDGLISADSRLVTMGGDYDTGHGMDETLAAEIEQRLQTTGLELMKQPDYNANLTARRQLYEAAGIDCFVAVGGNTTSLGQGETTVVGQGLLESTLSVGRIDEKSGLVQWYQAQGLPVINLLNIKQIVADYALPFDPLVTSVAGESAVFYTTAYPRGLITTALASVLALLVWLWWMRRPVDPETQLSIGAKENGGKPYAERGTRPWKK